MIPIGIVPFVRPAAPPKIIGRYEVREQVGAGTFGAVYLCYDPQLKRNVAIKVRHEPATSLNEGAGELLHEAQSVARLRHPGIVAVLDTGVTDDGRGYIVYEYVEGTNLKQRIEAVDFRRDEAVQWVAETADALNYAHLQGLVHRDIKPGNILIDRNGHTRLADFGLAKIDDRFFTDDAGRVLGTVAYMSPRAGGRQIALGDVAIGYLFAGSGAVRIVVRAEAVQCGKLDRHVGAGEISSSAAAAHHSGRYS